MRIAALLVLVPACSTSSDRVKTPQGWFDPTCIAHVGAQEHVNTDGSITAADGTTRDVPSCDSTAVTPAAPDARGELATSAETNGWVLAAGNHDLGSLGSLSAYWMVPSLPPKSDDQDVFLFPGLQDYEGGAGTILQPVLTWNGATWYIGAWNCCKDGTTYTTDTTDVNPGDLIFGDITSAGCDASGVCSSWTVSTIDVTTGQSETLDTSSWGQHFDWYFGGVLESYGVTSCAQMPGNGVAEFYDIELGDLAGHAKHPTWTSSVQPFGLSCGFATSGSGSTIDFSWQLEAGHVIGVGSGQCLDVMRASHADGAAIDQFPCGNRGNQSWQFVAQDDGTFELVVASSGQCLDVAGASTTSGAAVDQWPCTGELNQRWQIVESADATFELVNEASGQCLDVTGASTANSALIDQWPCTGQPNQQWKVPS